MLSHMSAGTLYERAVLQDDAILPVLWKQQQGINLFLHVGVQPCVLQWLYLCNYEEGDCTDPGPPCHVLRKQAWCVRMGLLCDT